MHDIDISMRGRQWTRYLTVRHLFRSLDISPECIGDVFDLPQFRVPPTASYSAINGMFVLQGKRDATH
jgi:hypothetical protein